MRLSFSMRGWSDYSWDQLVDLAVEMDFRGIELYNPLVDDALIGKGAPLDTYNVRSTVRGLHAKKLSIPAIDTSLDISESGEHAGQVCELIDLAASVSCPYVCVKAQTEDEDAVRATISAALPHAKEKGIILLVETSGIYADTARLTALLDEYASDYLGALWDVYHPYRDCKEKAGITIKNLGA